MTTPRHPKPSQLRKQLKTLADDTLRWGQAEQSVEAEHWAAAIDQLNTLAADVARIQRALGAMAQRINSRHWSPLLEMPRNENSIEEASK